MGSKVDPKVFHSIQALCKVGMAPKKIIEHLRSEGITVSDSTVYRVKNCVGKRNVAMELGLPQPSNNYPLKKTETDACEKSSS